MKEKPKILLSWSSGKDSTWALHVLKQEGEYEVVGLLTTLTEEFDRVSMHAVRRRLLQLQCERVDLPLWEVRIPAQCSNEQYQVAMASMINKVERANISAIAFGDLFLEDIRSYREKQLAQTKLSAIFPLWQFPTAQLANTMTQSTLSAVITCLDTRSLSEKFAGRSFDQSFLSELPEGVDPCGENGEFHTFCHNSPDFSSPIEIATGGNHRSGNFLFFRRFA